MPPLGATRLAVQRRADPLLHAPPPEPSAWPPRHRLLSRGGASTRLPLLVASGGLEKLHARPPGGPPDLDALLAAVADRRDRSAFAALFAFYGPRLKGYLLARGAAPSSAEEIVQDVMLTVWRKAQQFDPSRGSASAWVFTLARNAWIDCVRREHRPAVDPGDPLLRPAQDDSASDTLAPDAESLRDLATAIDALPAEQRHVVQCSFFRGQSLAEISAADRLPIGTVKTRARLALARLRVLVMKGRQP